MNKIKEKIHAGAVIIDVRSPDEYADGCCKGAINIPLKALQSRLSEIGPKDKPVVLYCASGSRSAMAALILKSKGFADVTNAGGMGDMPN